MKESPITNVETEQGGSPFAKDLKGALSAGVHWFMPMVGFVYASGFLIVFTFFREYGMNAVDFLQAKYMHIGSLFVMSCITIVLPLRYFFMVIKRWLTVKDNRMETKEIFVGLLGEGPFWRTLWERIIIRFFWSDWKRSGHGLHATFPVIGSATLMLWSFLLLLTFARPDFQQAHPGTVFCSLLMPFLIIAVALPVDRLEEFIRKHKISSYLHPDAETAVVQCNCLLRILWTLTGPGFLVWFFWERKSFEEWRRPALGLFFGVPLFITAVTLVRNLCWTKPQPLGQIILPIKPLDHRITIIHWVLYPFQWFLFLVQCWCFCLILTKDYLSVSLRVVLVGEHWQFFKFPWRASVAAYQWFFHLKQTQSGGLFPTGGFTFVFFIVLLVFFAFRFFYRTPSLKENKVGLILSSGALLSLLYYFAIVGFARNIYPYIPAVKGGGDYSLSRPVQLFFHPKFEANIPGLVKDATVSSNLVLLDANSSFVFVALRNDAHGPEGWHDPANKPTVYQIPREALVGIAFAGITSTNNPEP